MRIGRRHKAPDVVARSGAVIDAVVVGRDYLDPEAVSRAESAVEHVQARLGVSGDHTVVALAGATGSGKSSLFNALAGIELAAVGARRPTTAEATACVWGTQGAASLLDWLSVPSRHRITRETILDAGRESDLQGLVLLDLPDYDSVAAAHRAEVDRLLALVDVFVWVTDPQKYADNALHERYLKPLAGHDGITVVVLNQADRLPRDAVEQCRRDLARLLAEDGLDIGRVLVTSARTGSGVPQLRSIISEAVQSGSASRERLAADLDAATLELRAGVAEREAGPADLPAEDALVDALAQAAGVPAVLDAVESDYRRGAVAAGGWPVSRWLRGLRPDPVKRLRLSRTSHADQVGEPLETVLRRSSLPRPTPAQRARVDLATRRLGDAAAAGLPRRWADAVRSAAEPPGEDVSDALDQAVLHTNLGLDRPTWFGLVAGLQWLLATVALLGLVWLAALTVFGWLSVSHFRTPRVADIPVPTALLVGGLVLGFLLGLLVRAIGRRRAAARRARTRERLIAAITTVVRERITKPVEEILALHRTTRETLARALR